MIRLMLEPVNFLVLDEPTNHLDMQSKEILKEALIQFTGSVIVVSHDREFLDGMVDCVYEFRNKKIKQHLGGIYEFLQRRKLESLKALEMPQAIRSAGREDVKNHVSGEKNFTFEERKEINRNISKFERVVSETEKNISALEKEIAKMDEVLSSSGKELSPEIFSRYDECKALLTSAMDKWEREHEELEKWKTKLAENE